MKTSRSAKRSASKTTSVKGTSNYSTLAEITKAPGDGLSTFGVIIDATGSYKTYDSTDYVTKLKIIDQTWNFQTKGADYKKFIQIFIYTPTAASAPKIGRIGDIVRMKQFNFRVYQSNLVKGLHNRNSEWGIYDGRSNANISTVSRSANYTTSLSSSDKAKVRELKDWAHEFFAKHSLRDMDWFDRGNIDENADPNNNAIFEQKDVDLLAKVLQNVTYIVGEDMYHKLAFVDEIGDKYFAEYRGRIGKVDVGDVVKLRSISIIKANDTKKVGFSSYSAILLLDKAASDSKVIQKNTKGSVLDKEELEGQEFQELHLDKMQKIQVGLNTFAFTSENTEIQAANLRDNIVKGYPVLENFEHGEDDFLYENNYGYKFFSKRGSAVLKKYSSSNYYTFKELLNIQEEIMMNPEMASKYQHQKFLVRGFILATEYDYIYQTSKLYSPSQNRVWDFDLITEAQATANDLQVILHNVFYMKDQSIETEQRCFPVYLITFDGNPQVIFDDNQKYAFDLWKTLPDHLDVEKWTNTPEPTIKRFSELMENLKAPQYFYDMVIQLMVNNQGKVYFRMTDTIFWFNN